MKRKSKLKNIGQVPGTPIYTGIQPSIRSEINVIDYNKDEIIYQQKDDINELDDTKRHHIRWIDLIGVNQIGTIEKVGEIFGIHPLILEDIVNIQQRPKIEDLDDEYLFVSLKMFYYSTNEIEGLSEEQISLVLGKNYLISFQEKENDDFNTIKERIKNGKGRIRKMRADYLAYSIIDTVIDNYFLILEHIEDDIESLQEELLTNPTAATLSKIQKLKQNMIILRKSIWPVREIINFLLKSESSLISEDLYVYLKDLYDHTIQVIDTIETFRDIVSGSLDIYLSSSSNKLNEVMKVLTIIGTIFIPLTFLTGLYGMNFKFMPELDKIWAYPTLLVIMFAISVGMLIYFKKKKWI